MDLPPSRWILSFLIFCLCRGVCSNSVAQKIYVTVNNTVPCVRLLNATHQIGCQSSLSGNVGVIHLLESEENLEWVLSTGPHPPYMVLLEPPFFTRSIMMRLKNSSRVAGVARVAPNANPTQGSSSHTNCPNENTGLYTESYNATLAHCNTLVWNPQGDGLAYESFDFPVFSLKDDDKTAAIRKCYMDHNHAVNGSVPTYPLCAMELSSHMHAVTDTGTCMRRNHINFSLSPEMVCDAVSDSNVWASTKPLNNTAKGHKQNESVVIAAARLDSSSFFTEISPGAESAVSGFVTLLAVAQALRRVTLEDPPPRTIFYTFFQGETFDYIGSSRMVYDMENNQSAIDLDNVHSVVEIGQVGLHDGSSLWLHSDPVSRRNDSINEGVRSIVENFQSAGASLAFSLAEPGASQPLPPSSFQRFLRARPIPGIVVTDHQAAFRNRFYEGMYDNAEYLNLTYPPNLSPEQQLEFVTDTAKGLTDVATVVARALYKQAGGAEDKVASINASSQIVTQMLYGFLVNNNNSWFQAVIPPDAQGQLTSEPLMYYVGVNPSRVSTLLVKCLLANFTGTAVNITRDNCTKQRENEDDTESKDMYYYIWAQGSIPLNGTEREGFCMRSSVRLTLAESPAFLLGEYRSSNYSTWTESRWKSISARVFLVASHDLEMLTLGVGVGILLASLLLTYVVSSKADILFSSGREPANATY